MTKQLFEQVEFQENPLYEKVISELIEKGFSVVDHFFEEPDVHVLRDALLRRYAEDRFKKAAIGNRTNETIEKEVRGDFIMWMDETNHAAAEQLFFGKINQLVGYLNKTCFLGILHKEFHYAVYPEGTFYKRHLDTFQNDDRRKLSMVCYLNDQDWQPEYGGELVLYLEDGQREKEKHIYPLPGRMVIFESQVLEHEVRPVKKPRLSITGWLKTR